MRSSIAWPYQDGTAPCDCGAHAWRVTYRGRATDGGMFEWVKCRECCRVGHRLGETWGIAVDSRTGVPVR